MLVPSSVQSRPGVDGTGGKGQPVTTSATAVRAYFGAFGRGHSRKSAARIAGISERTAGNLERRYRREPLPAESVEMAAPERCCDEPRCRRTHPVLIRREGDRWYAVTKYVLRLDGSLSITERHDITEQMRELAKT
jgi:hypothetical protein